MILVTQHTCSILCLRLLTSIPKWQHIILPFLLNFFQSGSKADKDPKTEAATNDRHLFSLILNIFAVVNFNFLFFHPTSSQNFSLIRTGSQKHF